MTRRVIEEIRKLNESHGFLRGIVAMLALSRLMSIMIEMKGFLEPETTTGSLVP